MIRRLPFIIAAAGILLRILPIWAMPTWYDENFTILVSRLPLGRLFAAVAGDVHPPLWYLIAWVFEKIPLLPPWLSIRLPALLASIAALGVFWLVLQAMDLSDRGRLAAFALFAFLPQQIYYAQEGRMYSLLTLLVLLAWLCILHHKWSWLIVVTALLLYTHNYGLIYAAAIWLAGVVKYRYRSPITIPMLMGFVLFSPWILVILNQMGVIQDNYWIMHRTLPSILSDLSHAFFAVGMLKAEMLNILVFYGALLWVIIAALRHKRLDLPTLILAVVPALLAAVITLVWQPVMLARALIPSGAFLCLLLAEPLEYISRRSALVLGVFVVPALLANLVSTEIRSNWADETLQANQVAFNLVDTFWQPGDLLYTADDGFFVSGSVGWQHVDKVLRVPPCGYTMGGLSDRTRAAMGLQIGEPVDATRIWILTADTPLNTGCETQALQAQGLLDGDPLYCPEDDQYVRSCLYLVEQ